MLLFSTAGLLRIKHLHPLLLQRGKEIPGALGDQKETTCVFEKSFIIKNSLPPAGNHMKQQKSSLEPTQRIREDLEQLTAGEHEHRANTKLEELLWVKPRSQQDS
ncbi:hypothetical protein DNTS_001748 [Danionella cerebrum]|uniref:Uncharacterized protein n=1 Tax=Danionella cerebrum TaxID=2873325 RepID=A0A553MRV0_9TELE|nr:hypothetical protein DNTS_001748 [Danionella translucida]